MPHFQGSGGAGTYSLAVLFGNEIVSREKHSTYGELVAMVIACATFSGPLFGGFISDKGSYPPSKVHCASRQIRYQY